MESKGGSTYVSKFRSQKFQRLSTESARPCIVDANCGTFPWITLFQTSRICVSLEPLAIVRNILPSAKMSLQVHAEDSFSRPSLSCTDMARLSFFLPNTDICQVLVARHLLIPPQSVIRSYHRSLAVFFRSSGLYIPFDASALQSLGKGSTWDFSLAGRIRCSCRQELRGVTDDQCAHSFRVLYRPTSTLVETLDVSLISLMKMMTAEEVQRWHQWRISHMIPCGRILYASSQVESKLHPNHDLRAAIMMVLNTRQSHQDITPPASPDAFLLRGISHSLPVSHVIGDITIWISQHCPGHSQVREAWLPSSAVCTFRCLLPGLWTVRTFSLMLCSRWENVDIGFSRRLT
ncbi:hypothetical protein DFH07DRAFT_463111 [Mycena maculata]|uniref:Uncharacterized protein n=1 Tax=Mycena maculata TaxID=230809 RepID=A0AAD7NXQ1_9AGAR|nr:hypothetical protein DFH07DRAFT_463111 [Mycena maculata]